MRKVIAGTLIAVTALGATAALAKDGAAEEQRERLEMLWNKDTAREAATRAAKPSANRSDGRATKATTGRTLSDDARWPRNSLRWQRSHRGQFGR